MNMQAVSIKIPDSMVEYTAVENESEELLRNAMILFPYIQNETISHGKAAQILGINKLDLIALYSTLGIPYLDQTKEELQNDLAVLKKTSESFSMTVISDTIPIISLIKINRLDLL